IQTAVYLAKIAGAHLYVVHLSSKQGLEVVKAARREGARFTVETTSPYLGISSDDPNGFLAKMVPPVRSREHGAALWSAVLDGKDLQGMSDFSPFEGKKLRGWPVATIKAGEIVARDGKIVGPPTGRYIPRGGAAKASAQAA